MDKKGTRTLKPNPMILFIMAVILAVVFVGKDIISPKQTGYTDNNYKN